MRGEDRKEETGRREWNTESGGDSARGEETEADEGEERMMMKRRCHKLLRGEIIATCRA